MIKKIILSIFLTILISSISLAGIVYYSASTWKSDHATSLTIVPGMNVHQIATKLHQKGIIATPTLFKLLVRVYGLSHKMKTGTYDFPKHSTVFDTLDMVTSGQVRQYSFTIIEGWTMHDIAASLRGKPFLANPHMPDEFLALAKNKAFAKELGLQSPTVEGYLYPDTYHVSYPLHAKPFLKRLIAQSKTIWNKLNSTYGIAPNLSYPEIITLASIVEKETGAASERTRIASVFVNRLVRNMLLQSDPTIIYGLKNFDGNIRRKDIRDKHKYNTYVHRGLPPGPICNPGKKAILATMQPEKTPYLYFVSKNNGTHYFSVSLKEHNNAVRKYQLKQ